MPDASQLLAQYAAVGERLARAREEVSKLEAKREEYLLELLRLAQGASPRGSTKVIQPPATPKMFTTQEDRVVIFVDRLRTAYPHPFTNFDACTATGWSRRTVGAFLAIAVEKGLITRLRQGVYEVAHKRPAQS